MRAPRLTVGELRRLLARVAAEPLSAEARERQIVSFAYGNARMENSRITREIVERAADRLRSNSDDK